LNISKTEIGVKLRKMETKSKSGHNPEGFKLQGEIDFQDLKIMVENRKGSVRKGVDKDGTAWETKMIYPYGYISDTVAADNEHVDCYVGDNRESDKVFIVHQVHADTEKYDEDKVMLGFDNKKQAKQAYLDHYNSPNFFGSMTTVSVKELKKLLKDRKGEKLQKGLCVDSQSFKNFIMSNNLSNAAILVIEGASLIKGKKVPVGTVTNGYKKVAEGKWQKVSEHGMTKKEHDQKALFHEEKRENARGENSFHKHRIEFDKHDEAAKDLDDKEYDDTHVLGKKKEKSELGKITDSVLREIAKKGGKAQLYDAVNKKFGTSFKAGSIEEFEDDVFRKELTAADIKNIVEDEKENYSSKADAKKLQVEKIKDPAEVYEKYFDPIKEKVMENMGIDPEDDDEYEENEDDIMREACGIFEEKYGWEHPEDLFEAVKEYQKKSKNNLKKALQVLGDHSLEKGGPRAAIGEIRQFGGKDHIKTAEGWKFHGKGTGKKATERSNAMQVDKDKANVKHTKKLQNLQDSIKEAQKRLKQLKAFASDPKTDHLSSPQGIVKVESYIKQQKEKLKTLSEGDSK
jgi:hypothetical protein